MAHSAPGSAPHNLTCISPERSWTQQRQAAFLRHLCASHCVSAAARSVGMSRQSVYRLRARLKGEPFDIAWQAAFRQQFDALAQAALERALNGVEVPHFHKGELVGTSRRYDERLTVALLAMRGQLTAPLVPRHYEQTTFGADDFEALVERVETGDSLWAELEEAPEPDLEKQVEDQMKDQIKDQV